MEFNNDGTRKQLDPISLKATGIGPSAEGFRAPSGHEGAPANGQDFPPNTAKRNRAAQQRIEEAVEQIQHIGSIAEQRTAVELGIDFFLHPDKIEDAQLHSIIHKLHEHIAVIPKAQLESLPEVDTSSTEAEAVFFSKEGGAVYKLYRVEKGAVILPLH